MPSNHFILCRPLLLPPSVFPSIRVFSNKSVLCIRSPEYWSFTFRISPSDEYSALISFRTSWFDLLGVQGTLKSLLQHHSSKASILRCSAFFIIQLSHPYITTGKTITLTRWTFVGKLMSLLLNMLSRLVIAFLPRNKCLLTSWLHPKTELRLQEAVLCTRGNEVCIDYRGGQLCSDHGMGCVSASSGALSLSLAFVSSCKRYMSLRGSVATHRQVFLGNQLQTTQGTAIDEA